MSDAIERFVKWKHKQVEDTWPLALLSPVYDVGLVLGLFKTPAQYRQSQYWQPFSQQLSPYGMGACPNCGSPLQPYVNFCDRCGTHVR